MKQMMLPFATFSLYAALELFMTARANRPHEESYRDLKLDVGTSTGELKLTLATGNLGGGKPQPEFEGGDWEEVFGPFEKLLGGMILATGKGCAPDQWEEKYTRYKNAGITCLENGGGIRFNNKNYVLPVDVGSVLGTKETVEKAVGKVQSGANLPDNRMYKNGKAVALEEIFQDEVDTKGGRFSTPEGCLKERIAYPYFEAGFMELVDWYQKDNSTALVQYLRDLRGNADDLKELGKWEGKPETQRENQDASVCAQKKKNDRAQLFTKDGKLDWVSMAFWDFYVVKAYIQWITNEKIQPQALVSMSKTKEAETILGVARHFMQKADIFFVQESGEDLCVKLGKETVSHCKPMVGTDEKPTNTYDAAIFLKTGTGTIDNAATKEARDAYNAMVKKVIEGKGAYMKDALEEYILQGNNHKKATAERKKDKENPLVLGKVELAVATLGGVRVLLASAHPDSDGILCAFQLYLVKKVFEDLKKEEPKLAYLIVGMDVNLMTDGDFALKKDENKNGFNEKTFYPTTDKDGITPFGADTEEWKASPVGKLGFDVLWPKVPTVNKRRTFLQTQLNKAAKHDQVRKDMVFIYPKGNIVGTVPNADVCNKKEEVSAKCYDGEGMYPRDFWPMDHCVSIAGVELQVPPVQPQ